jgi:hypothetical protein
VKGEGVSLIRPVGEFGQGGRQLCHFGEFPVLGRNPLDETSQIGVSYG